MAKYVYDFAEGNKDLADLLGGKGANLAEMTNLGLPVPPGFTITTEACRTYLKTGKVPTQLASGVRTHLAGIEKALNKTLGDPTNPLLVSVRSGSKFSMPGMMETVLNVGLTDESVVGLAHQSGDGRFAWDSYRRLVQMYGKIVMGVDNELFENALENAKSQSGARTDLDLTESDLRELTKSFQQIVLKNTGRPFPQDPQEQLDLAIEAVFDSWNSPRAKLYRRQERIPDDLGTAVSVVAMVFGNLGPDSGTGVAFTRDPATGSQGIYGDYLPNAQGEDVVSGIRNTVPLRTLEELQPAVFSQLLDVMARLERHYRDLCDIEFTVERGTLWMLQTRVGKRTAAAAFVIASQFVDEKLIDLDEALLRVSGDQLARLMFPAFDETASKRSIAHGVNASPGAASGMAAFDSARAEQLAGDAGNPVILVRRETNPDDLPGMIAARGILTSRGGKTSHAAVVARGMGKPCVCGADAIQIDSSARTFSVGDVVVREGDMISIDGSTGDVYLGEVPLRPSAVVRYFEGHLRPDTDSLLSAVHRLMTHADATRRMAVRANADTPGDAARARRFGAAGIGLCRTEHMFLGDRRELVERLILTDDDEQRLSVLADLESLQQADFIGIFRAMDGEPVTIRLLDPPLHEFLPDYTELSVEVATGRSAMGKEHADRLLAALRRLREQNPMLGLRGVRLGLVIPGLYAMQARAIARAAISCKQEGGNPQLEIMIPLVAAVQELEVIAEEIRGVVNAEADKAQMEIPGLIGTMIEVPRAAVTAGEIARAAEFFSFGTNDLTQLVWGFSRDDVEGAFFSQYLELGIFGVSPFESLDKSGVGSLVAQAAHEGRAARRDLHVGVCGEHGGDPDSIHFFHDVGLDYVSCSPFRVPVARLEAARAVLTSKQATS